MSSAANTDLLLGQHPIRCRCAECVLCRLEDSQAERAAQREAVQAAREAKARQVMRRAAA